MVEHGSGWAAEEFAEVSLGDKRLNARLIGLCDRFSDAPESPINQACADWAETKAAYRFFQNESVDVGAIMAAHRRKTAERAEAHSTILALQDTSYFVYTSHPKTEGLGKMSMKKGVPSVSVRTGIFPLGGASGVLRLPPARRRYRGRSTATIFWARRPALQRVRLAFAGSRGR